MVAAPAATAAETTAITMGRTKKKAVDKQPLVVLHRITIPSTPPPTPDNSIGVEGASNAGIRGNLVPLEPPSQDDIDLMETETVSVDGDASDEASIASGPASLSVKRKGEKRGRSLTTHEYVGLAEAKRKFLRLERKELEVRTVQELMDSGASPKKTRTIMALPSVEELAAGMAEMTPDELRKKIASVMMRVEYVASNSSNLVGPFNNDLRMAEC
ncbi:sam-dependent methyltransferase [Lasius niger]|uniref:Sam-dependent methyltransferase n=1 Tax=Lasius niger TaxID=67767 RepID=A0A0J7KLT4_LASNI|nr:sam-dependent methyltransferase [Lasius niger]